MVKRNLNDWEIDEFQQQILTVSQAKIGNQEDSLYSGRWIKMICFL